MIRPITCVLLLLACGSGLYLYRSKHRVYVLDRQIEHVLHRTARVREQIGALQAEWTQLDQPDRLRLLAGQFLNVQPTKPTQFASSADLDRHLPPVGEPSKVPPAAPIVSVARAPAVGRTTVAGALLAQPPRREGSTITTLDPPAGRLARLIERLSTRKDDHKSVRVLAAVTRPEPSGPAALRPSEVVVPRPISVDHPPAPPATAWINWDR